MKKRRKRTHQQDCMIANAIDRIEKVAATVMQVYLVLEPVVKAIVTKGRRIK